MAVPPILATSGKHQRASQQKKKGGFSSILTALLIAPAIILFFFCGIYVGSQFVHSHTEETLIGLPGTNNIIRKWSNSHLRGFDLSKLAPPSLHRNFRNFVPEPTGVIHVKESREVGHLLSTESKLPEIGGANKPDAPSSFSDKAGIPFSEVAPHLVTGSEMAPFLTPSLHARSLAYVTAPSDLDASNIIVGAWVYLHDTVDDHDMRTIFSNKQAGCESLPDRYGFSMYVNAWETNDHQLYVEYGGFNSGCNKINSNGIKLIAGKWYHVALSFLEKTVTLYIDGSVVSESKDNEPHQVQATEPFLIGQYSGGKFPLFGNVSHLAVVHLESSASTIEIIRLLLDVRKSQSIPGLIALYPFKDASSEVPDSIVKEIIKNNNGQYHFPPKAGAVEGLPFQIVDGTNGRLDTTEDIQKSNEEAHLRLDKIRAGMKHAWDGYKKYAWGKDELKPISKTGQDNWGGMGVTLVDSLDTLFLMGMDEEFKEARDWVAESLTFNHAGAVSVFETTIRELGGLLSAYELSGDDIFLDKAKELGDKLMPAFNTQSGIPTGQVDFRSGKSTNGWAGGSAILSELGTLQVEFRYLSYMAENLHYEKTSMKPLQIMHQRNPSNGLFPIKVSIASGQFADNMITLGALGDSFYEYLLKLWIQGRRQETWLRDMYDKAVDGVIKVLLKASKPSGLAYISDFDGSRNHLKMDHLVCFMPGILALGAYTDPKGMDSPRAQRDLSLAKGLMYTCREMYHRMESGISAEYVEFRDGKDFQPGSSVSFYILRPETAESLFVLYQVTGDLIYREWSWEIWEAIDKHCKTEVGYGALRNVRRPSDGIDDRMESFFLAETMKYLYIVQDPETPIDLNMYVFNTEAHPLRIFDARHHEPIPPS